MIKIALVDDHAIVRQLMQTVMTTNPDMETVADFESAEALLSTIETHDIDLIIMDISLSGMDGIEAITRLRTNGNTVPVLCLSMHLNRTIMNRAFKAGANGYVVKHDPFNILTEGIRQVAHGGRFISPTMEEPLTGNETTEKTLALLSPREREVFELVATGATALDIAGRLGISERTVDFHRRKIGEKTGLKRIPDIVKFAAQAGISSEA